MVGTDGVAVNDTPAPSGAFRSPVVPRHSSYCIGTVARNPYLMVAYQGGPLSVNAYVRGPRFVIRCPPSSRGL